MNIQESMNDLFEYNGAYTNLRTVPTDNITEFKGKLPEFLLELWHQHGYGSWHNGLYNICNPHDFDGLLSQIFHADKDFSHKDCHVFSYSAFGNLHAWSEQYGIVDIDLNDAIVSCDDLTSPEEKSAANISMAVHLTLFEDKIASFNVFDDDNKPLFARACKRLGNLEPGECYGFFPALPMGGAPKLENLKRVKALDHFSFLAQLQQFTLIDYLAHPIKVVRQIGG